MADQRKSLPAVSVPPEGYDLVEDYAYSHKMSVSEAVRFLLRTSPELLSFAEKTGKEVRLEVEPRGGYKERKGE